MRILVDGAIYSRTSGGGAIRYCTQLVEGLLARGFDVNLLVQPGARLRAVQGYPRCRIVGSVAGSRSYDVCHTPFPSRVAVVPGARSVVTVHDLIDRRLPPALTAHACGEQEVDEGWAFVDEVDHIVAISETTRRDLEVVLGVAADRVTVIHHGVSPVFGPVDQVVGRESVAAELGVCAPYILHVGARAGYKNFLALLEAFCTSRARVAAKLVVVGGEPYLSEDEREVASAHGLRASDVVLAGSVSDELLACLYAGAAVVAMPSLYEGFGYPIIEAQACGGLVACSRMGAFLEVGGPAPLLFDPTDVADIARTLEEALCDPHVERRTSGRDWAAGFSEDRMIAGYAELYGSLS